MIIASVFIMVWTILFGVFSVISVVLNNGEWSPMTTVIFIVYFLAFGIAVILDELRLKRGKK